MCTDSTGKGRTPRPHCLRPPSPASDAETDIAWQSSQPSPALAIMPVNWTTGKRSAASRPVDRCLNNPVVCFSHPQSEGTQRKQSIGTSMSLAVCTVMLDDFGKRAGKGKAKAKVTQTRTVNNRAGLEKPQESAVPENLFNFSFAANSQRKSVRPRAFQEEEIIERPPSRLVLDVDLHSAHIPGLLSVSFPILHIYTRRAYTWLK